MKPISFNWNGKRVTAYEFTIAGMSLVSLDCDTPSEIEITRQIGALRYPYMSLSEFQEYLALAGLTDNSGTNYDLAK